jgi:CHAT domain-containing protein
LILSPDGALWLLPWNAIPVEDKRFLVEDFSLRYVISGRELVHQDKQAAFGAPLLFADPAYDLTPDKIRAAIQAIFKDFKFDPNATRSLTSKTSLGRVPPLPSTRLEAEAITPSVEQVTGKAPIRYLGSYALESVVKRVKRPPMLVISTHGFFLPDEQRKSEPEREQEDRPLPSGELRAISPAHMPAPIENPLLRCGLMLAGCNQPSPTGDDGILTGMEIVGIDLRGTNLVVLSACQTGIGKVQVGEGVAGLRQAFQLAGAEGVVATLWQVPDRDSAILMRDLFENLAQDQNAADALRNAQLARISSRRERNGAAHPFFWAAWTVTGHD